MASAVRNRKTSWRKNKTNQAIKQKQNKTTTTKQQQQQQKKNGDAKARAGNSVLMVGLEYGMENTLKSPIESTDFKNCV